MAGLGPLDLVLLGVLGLVCGIGITAIGPGSVLATVALFTMTSLNPAQMAGTAIVTHIAAGLLGTAAYARCGQFDDPHTRRTAGLLTGSSVLGTPVGVLVNTVISGRTFGLQLGVFVFAVALLLWYRDRRQHKPGQANGQPGAAVVVRSDCSSR